MADSEQTLLRTYLSAVVLLGLLVNTLFGWSWADAVASLVIATIAARGGGNAWLGESCCAVPARFGSDADRDAGHCDCC